MANLKFRNAFGAALLTCALMAVGCGDETPSADDPSLDAGSRRDAQVRLDASPGLDAADQPDSGEPDAGEAPDAADLPDAGLDAGEAVDAAEPFDAADPPDAAEPPDADQPDAGAPPDAAEPPDASAQPDAAELPDSGLPDGGPDTSDAGLADGGVEGWFEYEPGSQTAAAHCGTTHLTLSVLADGVVRLLYDEPSGLTRRSYAVVASPETIAPSVHVGEQLEMDTGLLSVVVGKDCRVKASDSAGIVLEDPSGGGFHESPEGTPSVTRTIEADEHFYGFGERTGGLDKRGQVMEFWNTDCYSGDPYFGFMPGTDPLYQSVPFFIGLRGSRAYGVFTDNSFRMRFDMGAQNPAESLQAAEGGVIDQYLVAGPTMADVLQRYTWLTGRMPLPPKWTLGYHQSRYGGTWTKDGDTRDLYHSSASVTEVCDRLRAEGFPADGIWFDIQHMNGFRSFTWDTGRFGNPAELVAALEAKGFKTTVIVDPGLKEDPEWPVFQQGVAQGHFLMSGTSPFIGSVWPGPSAFPDFSAEKTRAWWGGLVASPLGHGVKGLWIDMNEPALLSGVMPNETPAAGDGTPTTMAEIHNVYALLEAKATYEGMRAAAPNRRPFVLTRAGFAGEQRYAAVWTGDAPSRWDTLEETVPMLLNLGLSGVPFVGSDAGGYGGCLPWADGAGDLFSRWTQLAAISPFFRNHSRKPDNHEGFWRQEPWEYGPEVRDISRAAALERYELLPYLYSVFRESSQTGAPILRPLVYEFAEDEATHTLGDQVMVGPWLMVAPVVAQGALSRTIHLPTGRWFEAKSGAVYQGPTTIEHKMEHWVRVSDGHDERRGIKAARPAFVREGAIIPRIDPMRWVDEKPVEKLYLDLYPAPQQTGFTLYEDDGLSFDYETANAYAETRYLLRGTETGAELSATRSGEWAPGARKLWIRVRRVDGTVTSAELGGTALTRHETEEALRSAGEGYWVDTADRSLVVAFDDRSTFSLVLTYDPAIAPEELDDATRAPVLVPFEVSVPGSTQGNVYLASSGDGWRSFTKLDWVGPGKVRGTVPLPRGQWFEYKFVRWEGELPVGWTNPEVGGDCQEMSNRYGFAAASPVRVDTVAAFRNSCPPG